MPRKATEPKTAIINSIASSDTYDIWASSDSEGSVKIWDGDGNLLR
jgi:WD40 repeat protein